MGRLRTLCALRGRRAVGDSLVSQHDADSRAVAHRGSALLFGGWRFDRNATAGQPDWMAAPPDRPVDLGLSGRVQLLHRGPRARPWLVAPRHLGDLDFQLADLV